MEMFPVPFHIVEFCKKKKSPHIYKFGGGGREVASEVCYYLKACMVILVIMEHSNFSCV